MTFPLLLSVLVTLWWLWFFIRRDRQPEPAWLLARTFAWGAFAWLVAAVFETSLGHWLQSQWPLTMLAVTLLTAIIEEGSKFLAASTVINERDFDEPMDGLVYAVTAALGFALVENLTYVLEFGTRVATWHALLTTMVHALLSAPQGYALGNKLWQGGRWWRSRGLALSILLHFVFNSLLIGSGVVNWPLLLALAAVVLLMIGLTGRLYLNLEARAYGLPQRELDSPRK